MVNPNKDFANILDDIDADELEASLKKNERRLTKIEEEALKKRRENLAFALERAITLVMSSYKAMGSFIAVQSFMNDVGRKKLTNAIKQRVIPAIRMEILNLPTEEKHFVHEQALSEAAHNTRMLLERTLRFVSETYLRKIQTGWDGHGQVQMMKEVINDFDNTVHYMEEAVLHNLEELKSPANRLVNKTKAKLEAVSFFEG